MNADGRWQLAGNAAELYEDILVPTVFRPWATDLLELAHLRQGERVLDVACGTGIVARLAAAQVGMTGEVTGLDLNAGMLRVAGSLPAPPGAPVTWIEGSALAMPLPDASFDVVLCQQGFQFLPDRAAGLQEVKRVLVPGGRVLLSIWEGETPYSSAMAAAVEKHVGLEPATTLRTSRTCPDPETVRSLMMQTGFRDARTCARSHALCYGISRPPQWPARLLRSAKENEWPWPTTCARDYWRTRTEMESAIEKSPTS